MAEAVWGTTDKNSTWEYINVFGELQYIEVDIKRFNKFFSYKDKYKSQGFTNVKEEIIKEIEKIYGSLDEAIYILSDEKIKKVEDIIGN